MKLVMTLLVRDEQDILRENLEYHLTHGVDEVVLMDNRSVDGTADIVREYERAGVLHATYQAQDDYSQGRWVTQMARRAIGELHADWVINCDADEFWWSRTGSIKDALAAVRSDARAVTVQRTNFVARVEDGRPFWQRMDVRRAKSFNALGLPLPDKVAHRALTDLVVEQGNHCVRAGGRAVEPVAARMTILHFPVRSRWQFFNKIAKGGAAYARNTELPSSVGETWRVLYGMYLDGRLDQAYQQELVADNDIAAGLRSGEFIHDQRLAMRLAIGTQTEVAS